MPSTSSKRRNELRYYKQHFYKSSGTWCLSLPVLMRQIIMHTPQIIPMLNMRLKVVGTLRVPSIN